MTTKSRNIVLISLITFLIAVIVLSIVFGERIQSNDKPVYEANGGYLFTFNIECVDTSGNLLKTDTMTGNETGWSFAPPEIDGYETTCKKITRNDITDWFFPPSNYDREATGSYIVVYLPID